MSAAAGSPEPKSERIAALDGYRGAAVLMIVVYHCLVLPLKVTPGSLLAYAQNGLPPTLWTLR